MNYGPRSILLHLIIQSTASTVFSYSLQTNIIFHTIRLILCFQQASEIDNLTVKLEQSILVVLCAVSKSIRHQLFLAQLTLSEPLSSPTSSITLVSYGGKTCCYTHHTFLLGSPNGRVICMYQALDRKSVV